jgi:hypothetical protein
MSLELTPRQALIVWSLLGQQGIGKQKDIPVDKIKLDRDVLEKARFVSTLKVNRAIVLQLEDKGWAWASENLKSPGLDKKQSALQNWLIRLDGFLREESKVLADFIGTPPEPLPPPPKPARPRKPSQTPAAVRKEIERAYLAVTHGRKGTDARLADVRAEIKTYDREAVDAALRRILQGDKKARLMRINDPRAIRPTDIDAAFAPAGEPFHILWIME